MNRKIMKNILYIIPISLSLFLLTINVAIGQRPGEPSWFSNTLADSALTLTEHYVQYDPSYVRLDYPNGDVAADRGVCTDVIIRAYRKVGIDLQSSVHSDMLGYFDEYPTFWGLTSPDRNIDHRRVLNLMTFFERFGDSKEITQNAEDYIPGDIVCWSLGGSITHIGLVSNVLSEDKQRYLIVHNIGSGQVLEDCLFSFKIIGHYTYRYKFL